MTFVLQSVIGELAVTFFRITYIHTYIAFISRKAAYCCLCFAIKNGVAKMHFVVGRNAM